MEKLEKAALHCEIKKTGDNEYNFIMSDETIDRDGEVIKVDGWDLRNFKNNNIVLWGHNHSVPGIGIVKKVVKENGRLVAQKVRFASPGIYELADIVHGLVDDGILKAVSVGYLPIEREYPAQDETESSRKKKKPRVVTTKAELYELSIVNVGANPNALRTVKSAEQVAVKNYSGNPAQYLNDIFEKGVISYARAHSSGTPKAPKDAQWNANSEVSAANIDDLKVMCAWVDSENPDVKSSYKFPHHKATGNHPVVFRACTAAIAVLNGGRGGANIPDADRKGVYNHIAKHIRDDFDTEPAPLKSIEEIENDPLFILMNEVKQLKKAIQDVTDELKTLKNKQTPSKYDRLLAVDKMSEQAAEKQKLPFKNPASLNSILGG